MSHVAAAANNPPEVPSIIFCLRSSIWVFCVILAKIILKAQYTTNINVMKIKDKIKPNYRVLVYDLHVEKQDIDFNEIAKIVNQECFEIESMDMFISITI